MDHIIDEYGDLVIHLVQKFNNDHSMGITFCDRIAPVSVVASYEVPVTCEICIKETNNS